MILRADVMQVVIQGMAGRPPRRTPISAFHRNALQGAESPDPKTLHQLLAKIILDFGT